MRYCNISEQHEKINLILNEIKRNIHNTFVYLSQKWPVISKIKIVYTHIVQNVTGNNTTGMQKSKM